MDSSPPGSSGHGILQARRRVGCVALLQGIFPSQGSNPCLLHLLHWQVGFLITSTTWEAYSIARLVNNFKRFLCTTVAGSITSMTIYFISEKFELMFSMVSCVLVGQLLHQLFPTDRAEMKSLQKSINAQCSLLVRSVTKF